MTTVKTATTLAAAAVAAAACVAATPANAATAEPHGFVPRPATVTKALRAIEVHKAPDLVVGESICAYGNGAEVCGLMNASSLTDYVSNMAVGGCVGGAGMWVHGEIVSPHGHFSWNTRSYYRSGGNCFQYQYLNFHKTTTPGAWKFRLWQHVGGANYKLLDQVSLSVPLQI